jgi:hypothetical protein
VSSIKIYTPKKVDFIFYAAELKIREKGSKIKGNIIDRKRFHAQKP